MGEDVLLEANRDQERRLVIRPFDIRRKSTLLRPVAQPTIYFTECRVLRGRLLPGSAGEHHRVRALHTRDAAFGWLSGDVGPTMAGVGKIRQYGALCLSEYADSGVRRRPTDHVSLSFSFLSIGYIAILTKVLRRINES